MLKKILKSILPAVLLKKIHIYYNEFRINTIDKVLFPEKSIADNAFLIKRDAYPFRITRVYKDHLDSRLQHQISLYEDWTQDEYLLVYDKECIIEPQYGWALTENKELIYPSLGFSRVSYLPKPALRTLRLDIKKLPLHQVLISLRDTGEENYFHFYNDVLAKLFFLEKNLHLPYETPILIAEALYRKSFFQYFLQHSYLKNRNWVVQQPGEYIRSKKTYFCKPLTHTASYYKRIEQLLCNEDTISLSDSERRIFITRSPKRLRFIENIAEIEAICKEYGFEIVDFDTIALSQQVRLLSESRYVIGIHGAGLVNMMFRGARPMSLLEILPPGEYYPFHYMLMAAQLGYKYDGLIGDVSSQKYSGSFYVNSNEFRLRIQALLA